MIWWCDNWNLWPPSSHFLHQSKNIYLKICFSKLHPFRQKITWLREAFNTVRSWKWVSISILCLTSLHIQGTLTNNNSRNSLQCINILNKQNDTDSSFDSFYNFIMISYLEDPHLSSLYLTGTGNDSSWLYPLAACLSVSISSRSAWKINKQLESV